MELIKNISTAEQPYLFTRHVHFLNFSRFGGDQPVYINIIRDPVNRFLSNYFFRRFGDWRGEQNHMIRTPSMRQEERYLDINVCILENYPECSNPRLFYIIPYFCGQHPRCREPGEWALERAKLNVNENFLLVGILEELEDVLLLLERFLPHYFKDVLSIYKNPEHRKLGNLTVTVKKTVPSPEAIQILYQRMRYEYEFYYYVKEQFHLLKRKFGLKSHIRKPRPRPEFFIPSPLETEEPIDDEEEDDEKWLEDIYKRRSCGCNLRQGAFKYCPLASECYLCSVSRTTDRSSVSKNEKETASEEYKQSDEGFKNTNSYLVWPKKKGYAPVIFKICSKRRKALNLQDC
nr:PREDICTED: uronyl 2-sulfotransferase isoform X1 [Apteryx mantelli mantelli]